MPSRLCLPVLLTLGLFAQADEPMGEYKAMSKILRHVLSLVTWPEGGSTRPLRLAVVGGLGFGVDLEAAMAQGTVGGRPAEVRFLSASALMESVGDYDAIFLDRGEEARLPALLARLRGRPILTLGFSEGMGQRGIMVNFFTEGERIKFEINPGRLKGAGLQVNPRLLKLARLVEG